jgi:hypothetical protein
MISITYGLFVECFYDGHGIVSLSSANHHDFFVAFLQSASTSKRCGENKVTDELSR